MPYYVPVQNWTLNNRILKALHTTSLHTRDNVNETEVYVTAVYTILTYKHTYTHTYSLKINQALQCWYLLTNSCYSMWPAALWHGIWVTKQLYSQLFQFACYSSSYGRQLCYPGITANKTHGFIYTKSHTGVADHTCTSTCADLTLYKTLLITLYTDYCSTQFQYCVLETPRRSVRNIFFYSGGPKQT